MASVSCTCIWRGLIVEGDTLFVRSAADPFCPADGRHLEEIWSMADELAAAAAADPDAADPASPW